MYSIWNNDKILITTEEKNPRLLTDYLGLVDLSSWFVIGCKEKGLQDWAGLSFAPQWPSLDLETGLALKFFGHNTCKKLGRGSQATSPI